MTRRGFSLLELIIVISIIAIVAGMGMVRYAQGVTSYRVELAARRVAADLDRARREARTTGQHQFFEIHPSKSFYRFGAEAKRLVNFAGNSDQSARPAEVLLSDTPFSVRVREVHWGATQAAGIEHLTFNGHGYPSRGLRFELVGGRGTNERVRRITVDASGGNISVE